MVVRLLNQRERRRKKQGEKKKKKKSRARVKEETGLPNDNLHRKPKVRATRSFCLPTAVDFRSFRVRKNALNAATEFFSLSLSLFPIGFSSFNEKIPLPGGDKIRKKKQIETRANISLRCAAAAPLSLSLSLSLYIYKKISLRQNNPMCPSSLVSGWFVACVVVRRKVEFFSLSLSLSLCFFFYFFCAPFSRCCFFARRMS